MKTFTKIKQWLVGGCVWYAIISLIFLIIDLIISSNNATHVVSATSFLLMFPFGLSMSGAGMLYKSKLPRWSRILLHYVISVVSFLLFMLLPAGSISSGVYVLLMLVLLTVIYWILFALVHIFSIRWKRVVEED
ncbi:MAG: hypothetical protein E7584_06055 [Ruminococcaceae bacterium]|nr:hypothetical protein [Oscillospiraceae bacterium]